jgi:hypothetical protein
MYLSPFHGPFHGSLFTACPLFTGSVILSKGERGGLFDRRG